MSSRKLVASFVLLWWVLGALLVWYSVQTALQALTGEPIHLHVAVLAIVEAVAGFLFLLPRTMRIGGTCLLAVFLVALALHAAAGEFASQLLLYAAAVTFVMVHGPASPRLHRMDGRHSVGLRSVGLYR